MATYCVNHVNEEVERLKKLGKVKKAKTKEGTCGHLGGCNTGNLDLVELKCDYGIKQEAPKVEETAEEESPEEKKPEADMSLDNSGSGTDAEEKPVEA